MAVGDEPLSLPSNLLAPHWLCDFRNNRRVHRRRLPSLHARCSQTRIAAAPYQEKFAYEFSAAATATSNLTNERRSGNSAKASTGRQANVRLRRNAAFTSEMNVSLL